MSTVNGGATQALPSTLNADVKTSTVNGDIDTDFPMTITGTGSRRTLDGTIGGGGRRLPLHTVNGGVTLERE